MRKVPGSLGLLHSPGSENRFPARLRKHLYLGRQGVGVRPLLELWLRNTLQNIARSARPEDCRELQNDAR
jgi:hypothetical protein